MKVTYSHLNDQNTVMNKFLVSDGMRIEQFQKTILAAILSIHQEILKYKSRLRISFQTILSNSLA